VSITVIAMCILSGVTDLRGALLGSAIMTLLNEPLRDYPLCQPVMYAGVVLLTVILLPGGIVPSLQKLLETRMARRAR
jgi:branched-chain amino acid transport system permease protein